MSGELFQIAFTLVFQIPLALVVWGWGRRYDKRYVLATILTLIPLIGVFYFYWYIYKTVRYLLDKVRPEPMG
jgi:hypothetical protein